MRHPFEKLILIELGMIGCAGIFSIFAIIKGFVLFAMASIYLIVISLICNAMIKWQLRNPQEAMQQLFRAIALFLIASLLLFRIKL